MGQDVGEKPPIFDVSTLDTYTLLGLFIRILSDQAWQHMGFRMRPGSDKVEKDYERARVAIDCVALLIDKLEPHVSDDEKNKLRGLITDLRINFVRSKDEK